MRLKPNETMAVVIDYQEKLMPAINENEKLISNSAILLKGLGETVAPIAGVLGEFEAFDKKTFSLLQTEEIKKVIEEKGRKNVLVCGAEAHICVLQTVIDLISEGFNVFLVEDCIGSRKPNDKAIAIKRAEKEGAFLTTYEQTLYELALGAANPHFKAISKLTK